MLFFTFYCATGEIFDHGSETVVLRRTVRRIRARPLSHFVIWRLLTALAVPSVSVSLWCRSSQTVCKEKHNNSEQQQRVSQSTRTTATTATAGRSRHRLLTHRKALVDMHEGTGQCYYCETASAWGYFQRVSRGGGCMPKGQLRMKQSGY